MTLLQLSGYALCAWVQSIVLGTFPPSLRYTLYPHPDLVIIEIKGVRLERRIPYRQYTILAALQVLMQGFTNLSMHYLNYPGGSYHVSLSFPGHLTHQTDLLSFASQPKCYLNLPAFLSLCLLVLYSDGSPTLEKTTL